MQTFIFFLIAALGEISGCYAFWAWLRLEKNALWMVPGLFALIVFAVALTKIDILDEIKKVSGIRDAYTVTL